MAAADQNHETFLSTELSRYRPRRSQHYTSVNVLLVSWKDDDIGVSDEIDALARVFRDDFNYLVWPYQIPSQNSQAELQLHISQFIRNCGGDEKLLLMYYGGHGGPTRNKMDSECTWAAKLVGGPSLDWSNIQPLFFGADCDVVILLDCCYAGQAVRARLSHNIEFLAATDKDHITPEGTSPDRPSFTKVLSKELGRMLLDDGVVTLPGLHRRLLQKDRLLVRQPFYIALSEDHSAGKIRLLRLKDLDSLVSEKTLTASPQFPSPENAIALYLRLSLSTPLENTERQKLLKWMTRDSPSIIKDIQITEEIISEARAIAAIDGRGIQPDHHRGTETRFPWLPIQAQNEANRLHEDLVESLCMADANQFEEIDVNKRINQISHRSDHLVQFLQDCLTSLQPDTLEALSSYMRTSDNLRDLASRISMRLTLLQENIPPNTCRVHFDSPGAMKQHLRVGKRDEQSVLVEYWYYELNDLQKDFAWISNQVARVSALLTEPKPSSFSTLPGLGYVHETLHGARFGLVYQLSEAQASHNFVTLSQLFRTIKIVPLELRKCLASKICNAIMHIHTIGWFHKNIKAENIIILRTSDNANSSDSYSAYDFENAYVIGFDCSRPSDTETWTAIDFTTKDNIYRHPERWGRPRRFERYHDIYALGILLLEIACWRPLPTMDPKKQSFEAIKNPEKLRDLLLTTGYSKAMHAVGSAYADAIKTCLKSRDWMKYEGWEFSNIIRQCVWRPLSEERCSLIAQTRMRPLLD